MQEDCIDSCMRETDLHVAAQGARWKMTYVRSKSKNWVSQESFGECTDIGILMASCGYFFNFIYLLYWHCLCCIQWQCGKVRPLRLVCSYTVCCLKKTVKSDGNFDGQSMHSKLLGLNSIRSEDMNASSSPVSRDRSGKGLLAESFNFL